MPPGDRAGIVTLLLDDRGASPKPRHRLTLLDRSVSRESEGREQPGGGGVATRSRKLPPEALALYPKDVDPGRGAVRVLHGKGDKVRTEGLDPGLRRSTSSRRQPSLAALTASPSSTEGPWPNGVMAGVRRVTGPRRRHSSSEKCGMSCSSR